MKSIEITFALDGRVIIEGVGFKGRECQDKTRYIEDALGVVGHRVKKPEYNQTSTSNQQEVGA